MMLAVLCSGKPINLSSVSQFPLAASTPLLLCFAMYTSGAWNRTLYSYWSSPKSVRENGVKVKKNILTYILASLL